MDITNELNIICSLSPYGIKNEDINNKTILTSNLGFESVRIVWLIIEIEKRFNISLSDKILSLSNKLTFKNLVSAVKSLSHGI